jgi:hypothetical protein
MLDTIMLYYGCQRFEKLHPLQCGLFRRKVRTTRRPTFKRENPLVFYPKHLWETVAKYSGLLLYYLRLARLRKRILAEPNYKQYTDLALSPVEAEDTPTVACCEHEHDHEGPAVVTLAFPSPKAKPALAMSPKHVA